MFGAVTARPLGPPHPPPPLGPRPGRDREKPAIIARRPSGSGAVPASGPRARWERLRPGAGGARTRSYLEKVQSRRDVNLCRIDEFGNLDVLVGLMGDAAASRTTSNDGDAELHPEDGPVGRAGDAAEDGAPASRLADARHHRAHERLAPLDPRRH